MTKTKTTSPDSLRTPYTVAETLRVQLLAIECGVSCAWLRLTTDGGSGGVHMVVSWVVCGSQSRWLTTCECVSFCAISSRSKSKNVLTCFLKPNALCRKEQLIGLWPTNWWFMCICTILRLFWLRATCASAAVSSATPSFLTALALSCYKMRPSFIPPMQRLELYLFCSFSTLTAMLLLG